MGTRAAVYLRQSLDVAEGIDRQRLRCTALVTARGWELVGEYTDNDTSASKPRGPKTGWARMIKDIEDGLIDVVVAVDLDRLLRILEDLLALTQAGAKVLTVDGEIDLTTADGEFRATMLAGIARFEARRKGERQIRANQHRASKGEPFKGGVRLTGYEWDGTVITEEAVLVRRLFEVVANGGTIHGLAKELNEAGVPTRNGGERWLPSTIRGMLVNPRYAGRAWYKGELTGVDGTWEPIVDEAIFDLVQSVLDDPRRKRNQGTTARKHLGSGLYLCGVCEKPVTTNGPRYWCKSGGHITRSRDQIDSFVVALLRRRLQVEGVSLFPAVDDVKAEALSKEATRLRARLETVAADYDAEIIDGARYAIATEKVKAELSRVESERAKLLSHGAAAALAGASSALEAFDNGTLDSKRTILAAVVEVRLLSAPRGSKTFRPETVETRWKSE